MTTKVNVRGNENTPRWNNKQAARNKRQNYQQIQSAFQAVEGDAEGFFDGLNASDKQRVASVIASRQAFVEASPLERDLSLMALVSLLWIVVAWLLREELARRAGE